MRELKFRAWDKKNKYMFYAGSLSGVSDFYMARYEEKNCTCEEFYNRFPSVDYEWMQYTGLKDNNGKQIFEGDIVEFTVGGNARVKDTISFRGGSFILEKRIELLRTQIVPHKNLIVIGNIYEKPELLSTQ